MLSSRASIISNVDAARGNVFLTARCTDAGAGGTAVYRGWYFNSDGKLQRRTAISTYVDDDTNGWNSTILTGIGADYEIMASNTGSLTQAGCVETVSTYTPTESPAAGSDALDTWLSLSTRRGWVAIDSGVGDSDLISLSIQIRSVFSKQVLATAVYTALVFTI